MVHKMLKVSRNESVFESFVTQKIPEKISIISSPLECSLEVLVINIYFKMLYV